MNISDKIFIEINKKIFSKIDDFLNTNNIKKHEVLMVSDANIWEKNHHLCPKNFENNFGNFLILENPKADDFNVQKIIKKSRNFKYIFGFGSGTINDLCKFSAHKINKKYFILISALSMNGYVSRNASIEINGHKKSLLATLPIAVFADLEILKNTPERLNKAGLADVLCFYSCNFDLNFAKEVFLYQINKEALKIQSKLINKFEKNYFNFSWQDEKFLKILFKMILNSGWAMTISESSAPASQSEHLLAHVLTMKYSNRIGYFFHGELISNTTINCLERQSKILETFPENLFEKIIENYFEEIFDKNIFYKLQNYFGAEIAAECWKELSLKKDYLQKNHKKILHNLQINNSKIYKSLRKNYFSKYNLIKIFEHFEINFSNIISEFDEFEMQEIIFFSKLIRNRITSLDIF